MTNFKFGSGQEKIYEIDPSEVTVPERRRLEYKRSAIEDLTKSILELGQLQPGLCRLEGDDIVLIAGERRRRACEAAKVPYRYILREDLRDPYQIAAAEFYENYHREDLTWQEKNRSINELHQLWQDLYGASRPGSREGHSIRDTARELQISPAAVQRAKDITPFLEHPSVKSAKSEREGFKALDAFLAKAEREVALDAALTKANESEEASAADPATAALAAKYAEAGDDSAQKEFLRKQHLLGEYDKRTLLGDFTETLSALDESFDVVFFDPPWGVEYDKVMLQSAGQEKFDDSAELFKRDFPGWIELLWEKMAPDSHLYLFFGIVWHQFVYDTLEATGFETNRMPILWKKKGAHRTRAPHMWPGRCYEAIAYARKGSKDLMLAGQPDIIETPQPTKRIKLQHPSAKHPDIYVELIDRSCSPGDKILDPMCGSGMLGVAAEHRRASLALDWTLIEKEDGFRKLALWNLGRGYHEIITRENTVKDESVAKTYVGLTPGSPEWKAYWNAHPEQQGDMLTYKKLHEAN